MSLVITIGREFGSGGREIGQKIAERLSVDYLDKELLVKASEKHNIAQEVFENVDERRSSPFGFMMKPKTDRDGYMTAPLSLHEVLTDEVIFRMQSNVIKEEAESRSCVIVGRCSDYVLSGNKSTFNVFIHADIDWRAKRVAKSYQISVDEAKNQIQRIDAKRKKYYTHFSGRRWGDAGNYDLTLNSSRLGIDGVVELVTKAVEMMKK